MRDLFQENLFYSDENALSETQVSLRVLFTPSLWGRYQLWGDLWSFLYPLGVSKPSTSGALHIDTIMMLRYFGVRVITIFKYLSLSCFP